MHTSENREKKISLQKGISPATRSTRKKPFLPKKYIKSIGGGDYWKLRDSQETRTLAPAKLKTVENAIRVHNERVEQKKMPSLPPIYRLKEMLQAKRIDAITTIIRKWYRIAKSAWVGGETGIRVEIGQSPKTDGYSTTSRSSNGKWSGKNAHLFVTIQPTWLTLIATVPGLSEAGGKLTTHAVQIEPDLWKASWVEQGRGFELKVASGYILLAEGKFYHGKTEIHVRNLYKRIVKKQRDAALASARTKFRDQLWKEEIIPTDLLEQYPKLAEDVTIIMKQLRRFHLEANLQIGHHVSLDEVAEFPDLLEQYQKNQRGSILRRLNHGESVGIEELIYYPDLIAEYGV